MLFLDAFEVHKMQSVRDVALKKGFVVIDIGGGTTGIVQWNDTDLHILTSKQLQQLENESLHLQLEEKRWKMPEKTRQDLIDDVAAIWHTLDHRRIGRTAAKATGMHIALPRRLADGSFEEVAPEDILVSREARKFFLELDMPRLRAERLTVVAKAFDDGLIPDWSAVQEWMLPPPDDDIEREGEELWEPGPDGDDDEDGDDGEDDDSDDDGKGPKLSEPNQSEAGSVIAPASSEPPVSAAVLVADGGIDMARVMGSNTLLAKLSRYDELINAANALGDASTVVHLKKRRHETLRNARGEGPDIREEMFRRRCEQMRAATEARVKLREEERRRKADKAKAKMEELAKKKKAEDAKAHKEKLDEYAKKIDKDWTEKDFGQGSSKFEKKAEANIIECLQRLRLRTPPLTEEAEALWPRFLAEYPGNLWNEQKGAIGSAFMTRMKKLIADLGSNVVANPALPNAKPLAPEGGNPLAFSDFVKKETISKVKKFAGGLKL